MLFFCEQKNKERNGKTPLTGQYSASVDNTLLDLQSSSYPVQPHSIIATNSNNVRNEAKNET